MTFSTKDDFLVKFKMAQNRDYEILEVFCRTKMILKSKLLNTFHQARVVPLRQCWAFAAEKNGAFLRNCEYMANILQVRFDRNWDKMDFEKCRK